MLALVSLAPPLALDLPGGDGDGALGAAEADVVLLVLDRPLEEALDNDSCDSLNDSLVTAYLAGLAGEDAVVEAGDLVGADWAGRVDELLPGDARLPRQGRHLLRLPEGRS